MNYVKFVFAPPHRVENKRLLADTYIVFQVIIIKQTCFTALKKWLVAGALSQSPIFLCLGAGCDCSSLHIRLCSTLLAHPREWQHCRNNPHRRRTRSCGRVHWWVSCCMFFQQSLHSKGFSKYRKLSREYGAVTMVLNSKSRNRFNVCFKVLFTFVVFLICYWSFLPFLAHCKSNFIMINWDGDDTDVFVGDFTSNTWQKMENLLPLFRCQDSKFRDTLLKLIIWIISCKKSV